MDYETPAAVEEAFYAAFRALDPSAMREVWSDEPASYCLHPGGPALRGLDSIMQSWSGILASADPPAITFRTVSRHSVGDMAVHLVEESIRPSASSGDPPSLVVATNIYVRRSAGWLMMAHHASLPLVAKKTVAPDQSLH